jgi:F-type H+-transporting ATPase subunit delta
MAEKITIARPYAKAAFELARESNAYARWSQILAGASAVVADERVEPLLSSPRVTSAEIVALIAEASGATADEQGKNFFNTLAQNRRLGLLPEIAQMYETMRADVENVADVQVTSAVQLDEAQRQRLTAALKKRLQRDVRLHCDVDPSLIGGAVVRTGDFVIDGSLKARLDRLAAQITH